MKNLIIGLMLVMGLMFNITAKADPIMSAVAMGFGYVLDAKTLQAWDSEPVVTVKHATGSNYYFDVSQCDFDANKANYTVK